MGKTFIRLSHNGAAKQKGDLVLLGDHLKQA